jgi:hypothetical protein
VIFVRHVVGIFVCHVVGKKIWLTKILLSFIIISFSHPLGNRLNMSDPESNIAEPEERVPITSPGLRQSKSALIIFLQYGLAFYLLIIINFWYLSALLNSANSGTWWAQWWLWALLPLSIFGNFFLFPFMVLLITKVLMAWSFHRHPPREGVFPMDGPDRKSWEFRQQAMLFAHWLARAVPLPWIDMAFFKILGVKVRGNPVLYDSWVDTELVDLGRDNMLSLNAIIMSHMVLPGSPRKFVVKGVKTADFCILGAESTVAPGTHLEMGAIFGASSGTSYDQRLEGDWIYGGNPARKLIPSTGPVGAKAKAENLPPDGTETPSKEPESGGNE